MVTAKITTEPYVAEYICGKFTDPDSGVVRFPPSLDIYVLIWDLLQKRPHDTPVDEGNLTIFLPDRRAGKDPLTYNYLSGRSQKILNAKMKLMMWAELHEVMDENKHIHGIQFKETVYRFLRKYSIESISEDALLKNYQRWRDDLRRRKKRNYNRKKVH